MRNRLILLWMLLGAAGPAIGQVSIGIGFPNVSIGINVLLYPDLVPVPGYPIYYAPGLNSNYYFFYKGMYWVYQSDNWYASSWYDGPWRLVAAEDVPAYVLLVPVRYYRQPPGFFNGWQPEAPPRWSEHWGSERQYLRAGWERWDRNSAPAPAPLPAYQRQYSGDRYPRVEQQHGATKPERPLPTARSTPASADRRTQARPQATSPGPQGVQRSPASLQQSVAAASPASAVRSLVQRQQPAPASRSRETEPQGMGASPEAKRGQEPAPEKGREKADDRGQELR